MIKTGQLEHPAEFSTGGLQLLNPPAEPGQLIQLISQYRSPFERQRIGC